MLKGCSAKRAYISAFLEFAEFKRHTPQIAWETEAWIAEMPEHMIHYNGDRYIAVHGQLVHPIQNEFARAARHAKIAPTQ